MANFLADIIEAAGNEVIESVYVPKTYWTDDAKESTKALQGKVHKWEDVKDCFNYEYDEGFGGADCDFVQVWTATRILYIHEYDGSTSVHWVWRNPTDVKED